MNIPVLYGFRRCPYVLRAKLALWYAGIKYTNIEVDLKNKPAILSKLSKENTVPVMVLHDKVLAQSIDIMQYALGGTKYDNYNETTKEIIDTNDIWWSASDIGWIVGHSYIVYAPLFKGCTTVLFEGKPVGTPDAGAFWKIISDYKVKSLFTAPTAFRAIKKEDPEGKFFSKYDLSSFESLFLAGERADPDTIKWAENLLKVPVIDHWWQTETSWAISSNCTGIEMMETKYGSACKAVPGYDVKIIKPDQTLAKPNEMGDIVVKLPLALSALALAGDALMINLFGLANLSFILTDCPDRVGAFSGSSLLLLSMPRLEMLLDSPCRLFT